MDNFEILKTTNTKTYIKLPFTLDKNFVHDGINILNEVLGISLKSKYELDNDIKNGINIICVSDAHTHLERLVFPAFYVTDKETGEKILAHDYVDIAGKVS